MLKYDSLSLNLDTFYEGVLYLLNKMI